MMEIRFLTLDELLEIHRDQIENHGGVHGVRDFNLLYSAMATPMAQFDGVHLHPDIYAMAAAYLFHITQNHPFLDGNKRVGIVSALVFLRFNNIRIIADESALEEIVLAVAQGKLSKEEISNFFSSNSREHNSNSD